MEGGTDTVMGGTRAVVERTSVKLPYLEIQLMEYRIFVTPSS
jgi:hypothetical protein